MHNSILFTREGIAIETKNVKNYPNDSKEIPK